MTALASDTPTRPALALVPSAPDADLAAAVRTAAVVWQMLDRAQAELVAAREEGEWRRRAGVYLALAEYARPTGLPRQSLDPVLAEAGWARPEPIPTVAPIRLHQTASLRRRPEAMFHAVIDGRTACSSTRVSSVGREAADVPAAQRCRHMLCRVEIVVAS